MKRKLNASTLVEVLIAMVILLSVFGTGMLIVSNLHRTAATWRSQSMRQQLKQLREQYRQGIVQAGYSTVIDSTYYEIAVAPVTLFPDRSTLKIYAIPVGMEGIADSLISIEVKRPDEADNSIQEDNRYLN